MIHIFTSEKSQKLLVSGTGNAGYSHTQPEIMVSNYNVGKD